MFVVVVAVAVLLVALGFLNHFRLRRRGWLPEERRLELQAGLLEAIKQSSANQRTPVNIDRYWWRSKVTPSQRYLVIEPLLNSGVVSEPVATTAPLSEQIVSRIWKFVFLRPPSNLVLSDRDWLRMVHEGISGGDVLIIERIDQVHWNSIDSGGGTSSTRRKPAGMPMFALGRSTVGETEVYKRKT